MTKINIRNYKDNDSSNLEQLLKDIGIYYEPLDKKENFKKYIKYDSGSIILAEDNKKLIGAAFVHYNPDSPRIYRLGVHPDYKDEYVETKLMEGASKRLDRRGIKKILFFNVEENSNALRSYEKNKWVVHSNKFPCFLTAGLIRGHRPYIGSDTFIKLREAKNIRSEMKVLKYFSGINSIRIVPLCESKEGPFGYELIFKDTQSKNLEELVIPFLGKSFPKGIKRHIKEYTTQVAKIHAYGHLSFLKANNNLISEKDYYNRLSNLINQKYNLDKKRFDKILTCYKTVSNTIGNSKIKTFVKDTRLKNALSSILTFNTKKSEISKEISEDFSIFGKNTISLIDFDPNHLRLAPPQHDLSKILVFSVKDRKKFLDDYIRTYNSDVKVYNRDYSQYGIKQEIKDKKELEFVFLNSIVDYALFCTVERKYEPSSKFHKYQIKNAVYAIDELKHNWHNKYTKEDLKNLSYIKSFLLKGI